MFTTIIEVKVREILDSRGNPTIKADVLLGKYNQLVRINEEVGSTERYAGFMFK